jgi:hypothetical protein
MPVMAARLPDDESSHEWRADRSSRYWKKASEFYRQACNASSEETKALYMQVAMAWAALADEVERPPEPPPGTQERRARH